MSKTNISRVVVELDLAVDLSKISPNRLNDLFFEFLQEKTVADNGFYLTNIDVNEGVRPVTQAFLEGVE